MTTIQLDGENNADNDVLDVFAAYIKLINIPCMFDIGLSQVNPCDEQLNLNIIDDVTYHEVIRTELKKETELQSK